jgi:hypothetical protein
MIQEKAASKRFGSVFAAKPESVVAAVTIAADIVAPAGRAGALSRDDECPLAVDVQLRNGTMVDLAGRLDLRTRPVVGKGFGERHRFLPG